MVAPSWRRRPLVASAGLCWPKSVVAALAVDHQIHRMGGLGRMGWLLGWPLLEKQPGGLQKQASSRPRSTAQVKTCCLAAFVGLKINQFFSAKTSKTGVIYKRLKQVIYAKEETQGQGAKDLR